nr:hypothetical protein [Tanacetum cinerariifolium]
MSLNKELVTPYKEPERVLHSTRKLFKTLSLDYSSSPEFNLFYDLEDQCEEEVTKTMTEPNMEEYMTKTREDYGSGIARPKTDDKANFELKGQFLKELRDNTFSGSDNEDANEHIEKECFKELLLRCPQHYLTDMQEAILFYKGLDVPTRQILDSKGATPSMKAADAKKAIQDMADHSQKWHNGTSTRTRSTDTSDGLAAIQAQLNNLGREIKKVNEIVYAAQVGCESCNEPHYTKDCPLKEEGKTFEEAYYTQFERRQTMEESLSKFMTESAKRHDEKSNLIKEIRASTDAAIRNQRASIKALEIQMGQKSKVLQEKGFGCLPGSTETNPRDHVKLISTTIETDTTLICCIEKEVLGKLINRKESATYLKRLLREKPRMGYQIEASINVHESAILEDSLPPKEKALADLGASVSVLLYSTFTNLSLGELAPTKLIIKLADRTIKRLKGIAENVLVGIDKFVFPVDFIVLDMPEDIKVPLILERPFLSTAHAKIDVFKKKIALREKLLNLDRSLDYVYGDYNELNDLTEPLELRRNQVEDLVVESMDAYRDQDMGDVVVGEPFVEKFM